MANMSHLIARQVNTSTFERRRKALALRKRQEEEYSNSSASEVKKDSRETEESMTQKDDIVSSKLAALRKRIAHGIDEKLGTKIEEKKLPKPLKKLEKAVSDRLFGKVNE